MSDERLDAYLDTLDKQDAIAAEGERLAGEFRADCAICGKPFTDQEWLDRHTPDGDPMADVHAACCPDCTPVDYAALRQEIEPTRTKPTYDYGKE